jgi:RNA polymerase sigma factor (sigma-70 family)
VRLSGMEADADLTTFCRLEWPRLVGSLTLYTGDRDLAEELTQEALIRVCEHWTQVREAESASGWAHRVGFNLAKSQFRRRAALRRIRRLEPAQPDIWDPDTASDLAVRQAVAALPEPQRSALVLRYFADLPVSEVALLMACPTNTVKTHTRRALMALRDAGFGADADAEPRCLASGGTL